MRKLLMSILWLMILLALIAVMGVLLIDGGILVYLAPRMVPMVWFGFAVLIVLLAYYIVSTVEGLRKKQKLQNPRFGIVLFMVPVLLVLTVTPDQNTAGSLPNQNIKAVSLTAKSTAQTTQKDTDRELQQEQQTEAMLAEAPGTLLPCAVEEETTFFDSDADRFSDYIYSTLEETLGKTITVYGFVYTKESFPENTLLVSRKMITCCAADAAVVGFYVQLEDGAELKENEWIRVTGTVRKINLPYYGDYYDFPILTDGIIVHCKTPEVDKAYVYPI